MFAAITVDQLDALDQLVSDALADGLTVAGAVLNNPMPRHLTVVLMDGTGSTIEQYSKTFNFEGEPVSLDLTLA